MILPELIDVVIYDRRSEIEQLEEQIVGKLFRDLMYCEGETYNDATIRRLKNIIYNAKQECEMIGSDGKFLKKFIDRVQIYIGGGYLDNNIKWLTEI